MGAFAKIAKWAMIGAGSVLSLIPAVGPVVGGGLIAAGAAINVGSSSNQAANNSVDAVSNAASTLVQALNNATAYNATASGGSVINVNSILAWLKTNWMIIAGVLALIFFVPRLFRKR